MLPYDKRLHPRSRVRETIRHGRRGRSGGVVVHFCPDMVSHACVIAGKQVGNSVQRHRRQRQLRHLLAEMWDELPPGSLVVRALAGNPGNDLGTDLRRAVSRL